jgi:hypothetical protein
MAKPILVFAFAAVIFTAIILAQEQAPAPSFKEGDTWQFNVSRRGQIGSSTDLIEGMYELSVTQGVVKLYDINRGQRNEIPIQPW